MAFGGEPRGGGVECDPAPNGDVEGSCASSSIIADYKYVSPTSDHFLHSHGSKIMRVNSACDFPAPVPGLIAGMFLTRGPI